MGGIEAARDVRIRLIGERRIEHGGTHGGGESIAIVGQRDEAALRRTVMLNVGDGRITPTIILLKSPPMPP